jgi:hypothetical protein
VLGSENLSTDKVGQLSPSGFDDKGGRQFLADVASVQQKVELVDVGRRAAEVRLNKLIATLIAVGHLAGGLFVR